MVADRNGLWFLCFGLLISFVIGISLRTFIGSNFLNQLALEASKNIGKPWELKFEKVRFNLNKNYLPSLYIEADEVKIIGHSDCFMQPEVKIKKLSAPVSFINLFLGLNPIEKLILPEIEITFKKSISNCTQDEEKIKLDAPTIKKKNQIVLLDKTQRVSNATPREIHEIIIDKMIINYNLSEVLNIQNKKIKDFDRFIFTNVNIQKKSETPQIIQLKSKLDLNQINQMINLKDFNTSADIDIEYSEFPEKGLKINLAGLIREGSLLISATDNLLNGKFNLIGEIKNIPLSTFDNILNDEKYNSLTKSQWLTFNFSLKGVVSKIKQTDITLSNLMIYGDHGEVSSEQISIEQGEWLKPSDYVLKFSDVNVAKLAPVLMNADSKFYFEKQYLEHILINSSGLLNGTLKISSSEQKFNGILSNMNFTFDLNDNKIIQKIEPFNISAIYEKGVFKLNGVSNEDSLSNSLPVSSFYVEASKSTFQLRAQFDRLFFGDFFEFNNPKIKYSSDHTGKNKFSLNSDSLILKSLFGELFKESNKFNENEKNIFPKLNLNLSEISIVNKKDLLSKRLNIKKIEVAASSGFVLSGKYNYEKGFDAHFDFQKEVFKVIGGLNDFKFEQ